MPMVASSICCKCGNSFFINPRDMAIVPGMALKPANRNRPPKKFLTTWADWLEHVQIYCPECRYVHPPSKCIADWNDKHDKYITMIEREQQEEALKDEQERRNNEKSN